MIYDKKGLSTIIVTLILILLAIVAVGVVWVVVNNVLERGEENINLGAACLEVDVSVSTASCADKTPDFDECTVTYGRTASGDDIGGVTLVFYNDTDSNPEDISGNVAPLVTQTKIVPSADTKITGVNKIGIAAYLEDSAGNKQQTCTVQEFEI
ncbi:hypothetical protein HYT25_00575 [Candidatus Pacearchaeota archaeon]|nr:hypothetical protein [Candidatus Pacearchaeota archaeon]